MTSELLEAMDAEGSYLYFVAGTYWAFAEHEIDRLPQDESDPHACGQYELKAHGTYAAMKAAHRLLVDL